MSPPDCHDIPVFPLNTVLFPGGILQLKIFEQRYLEMTKRCLRDAAPFGVCLIQEGREVGDPALPHSIGCLATISQWDMPQLGLFHLFAQGGAPFRILKSSVARDGLIMATVELLPPEPPAPVDPVCRDVLKLVIDKAGASHFPPPHRLDSADWVAYRLAEVLPLDVRQRQRILEAGETAARFALLREILAERGLAAPG